MSDNETFLQAKVQFLAQQLTSAIDALCDANGNTAVYKAKLATAEARIAELESPKGDVNGNDDNHHD
jgi:hypothetical protein